MFEQTTEQMAEERGELLEHERHCNRLITLIEDNDDIEMSPYLAKISLATLSRISDVIAHRVHTINEHLERESNKALDNFMRRQV